VGKFLWHMGWNMKGTGSQHPPGTLQLLSLVPPPGLFSASASLFSSLSLNLSFCPFLLLSFGSFCLSVSVSLGLLASLLCQLKATHSLPVSLKQGQAQSWAKACRTLQGLLAPGAQGSLNLDICPRVRCTQHPGCQLVWPGGHPPTASCMAETGSLQLGPGSLAPTSCQLSPCRARIQSWY
jgi:hypothetical protein